MIWVRRMFRHGAAEFRREGGGLVVVVVDRRGVVLIGCRGQPSGLTWPNWPLRNCYNPLKVSSSIGGRGRGGG